MQNRFYSLGAPGSTGQLKSLSHYREDEQRQKAAVAEDGSLLERATLELRINPPNVRIDNDNPHHTVLIIDSANRPGTLVEVVQCLTELGLSVKHARISSDGGWFVDEFHVSDTPAGRVTDPKKLAAIRNVLSLPETSAPVEVTTVFQIAGPETPGLLAEVTQLLSHNGLEIRTAAAWTFNDRAAIVIGVTEQSAAVQDRTKLQRLQQLLTRLVEKTGDNVAVSVEQVEGPVHHERRLHQLLLADEVQAWKQLSRLQRQHSLPFPGPVNTHPSVRDSDTEPEADQVPSTPQQQWQRRMLPPLWSVDSVGRPVCKEDLRQYLQQQQQQQVPQVPPQQLLFEEQQQQLWLQGQMHLQAVPNERDAEGPFAVVMGGDSLAPETPAQSAAAAATASGGGGGSAAHASSDSSASSLHNTGSSAEQPALPINSAAADKAAADASAAAAAAQQASVDKLIALLQPQPLGHAISMPADRQQQQQQQQAAGGASGVAAGDGGAAAQPQPRLQSHVSLPGGPNSHSRHAQPPAPAAPSAQQPMQLLHVQHCNTAPLPRLSVDGAVVAAMAGGGATAGLPPRVPQPTHTGHGGVLPLAQQLMAPAAPAAAAGCYTPSVSSSGPPRHASSISAPSSPSMAPRGGGAGVGRSGAGSLFAQSAAAAGSGAVGGGDSGGGVSGVAPWSPSGMASASAAAGLLSPRAASVVGSLGGGVGAQQQQLQLQTQRQQSSPLASPVAAPVLDTPEVQIQHSRLFNYWLVEIRCRDRNKLFFDTVCTLADMRYDIFHATIDSEPCGLATQLFYIRPRFGECVWDERKASVLRAMLVSAVQRRFPPGLRLHVFSGSTVCLQDLVSSFRRHKLTITRCKVRAYDHASHTFYILHHDGSLPSKQYVQVACQGCGGELVEAPLDVNNPCVSTVLRSLDARNRFAFSFVNQRAQQRAVSQQAQQSQQSQQQFSSRGVAAPGGPIDIAGVLVGRGGGDGGGGGGVRRGLLQLPVFVGRGGGEGGVGGDGYHQQHQHQHQQHQKHGATATSYNSDQQPSF